MPRRRPSRLRATTRLRRGPSQRRPGLPAGSGGLTAALTRLERERLWMGATAEALGRWALIARKRPTPPCYCPLCHPFFLEDERQVIEIALHALPKRAARELRPLVRPLDDLYLSNTSPDPFADPDKPWWLRRHRD